MYHTTTTTTTTATSLHHITDVFSPPSEFVLLFVRASARKSLLFGRAPRLRVLFVIVKNKRNKKK
jgi:hypothetical protein